MAMSEGDKFEVMKFNGHGNFRLWQTRVKTLKSQKSTKMEDEDWMDLQELSSRNHTVVFGRRDHVPRN